MQLSRPLTPQFSPPPRGLPPQMAMPVRVVSIVCSVRQHIFRKEQCREDDVRRRAKSKVWGLGHDLVGASITASCHGLNSFPLGR